MPPRLAPPRAAVGLTEPPGDVGFCALVRRVGEDLPGLVELDQLGDMPFIGRFFRSERSSTEKKNLMIFVSPRIIDPAGNPVHTEDDWPYNSGNIPSQAPALEQARY